MQILSKNIDLKTLITSDYFPLSHQQLKPKDYSEILRDWGFEFEENENWLIVRKPLYDKKWILYISVRVDQALNLFDSILPVLDRTLIPFIIIRNSISHIKLNSGHFGSEMAGKVITLFPESIKEAKSIINLISPVLENFHGPVIQDCQRIGSVLYTCYTEALKNDGSNENEIRFYSKEMKKNPFQQWSVFKIPKICKILAHRYVLVATIDSSFKGGVYKAVDLKNFRMRPCLIKKANVNIGEDQFGRDGRDRLYYEKTIMEKLNPLVSTPEVIDYFEKDEEAFLVMEFLESVQLSRKILEWKGKISWKNLTSSVQQTLLYVFLQVLNIVESMHDHGYVHRDINSNNFLIRNDGKLYVIDFELCYSLKDHFPDPPFLTGTPGFVAPEQEKAIESGIHEDIYSLGALLSFFLSGENPYHFLGNGVQSSRMKLNALSEDKNLVDIIILCLNSSPVKRPSLQDLKKAVQSAIHLVEDSETKIINSWN